METDIKNRKEIRAAAKMAREDERQLRRKLRAEIRDHKDAAKLEIAKHRNQRLQARRLARDQLRLSRKANREDQSASHQQA